MAECPVPGSNEADVSGTALRAHWHEASSTALVGFSGFDAGQRGRPLFHFAYSTSRLAANRIFLRDAFGAWYHRGIAGISSSIDETVEFLAELFDQHRVRRTVFLGVSSGGYAALLCALLAGADEVHAISPRTTLDCETLRRWQDDRRLDELARLHTAPWRQEAYFDLRQVFADNMHTKTRTTIYYDPSHTIDRLHAEHLDGASGVTLVPLEGDGPLQGGGHLLAMSLIRKPWFRARLAAALEEA